MLIARYLHNGLTAHGVIEGNDVTRIEGDVFGDHTRTAERVPLADVRLLAPVMPRKILAAAVNYQSHVTTAGSVTKSDEAPPEPQLFLKPSSSVIGPEDAIRLPPVRRVDAEGELVAVIGRECRGVSAEEALGYVLGYTCGNDVSARHWQRDDLQWWRAKGSDTFSPIGPVIATGLDPADLRLITRVNGEEKQAASTKDLIQTVAQLISFASQSMTLEPGDLIFTGTPGETPVIKDGDTVEVEIEGIGVLRNTVVDDR
jgi:2-keto-4-pentenoate hydratase/2-oxohepta-3-ene-1,7-dioic acid hydratase in catechol pathway